MAPAKLGSVFFQGVASNVLNPKAALIFLAFLPQFVSLEASSAALQLVFLGSTFAMLGLVWFCTLAYFSGPAGNWLVSRPKLAGTLRWLTGGVLIGLGMRLALPDRR